MNRALFAVTVALLLVGPLRTADDKAHPFRATSMGEIEDTEATKAGFRTRGWPNAHFGFTSFKASNGEGLTVIYDDDFHKPRSKTIFRLEGRESLQRSFPNGHEWPKREFS